MDVVEKQKRKFFDAKIESQIKGILNCEEQMDTWNTKRRHRYADVLIADKFRDSEIEVMNKVRERRRKQQIWHDFAARVNSGLGRSLKPSLLPVELAAEEMALCGYKARNKKSSAARSMSCEPILDQSLLVERLRKTVFQGALADLTETLDRDIETPDENWMKKVDTNSGRYYYFNLRSGLTSWDPPENSPPEFVKDYERFTKLQNRKREEESGQNAITVLVKDDQSSPEGARAGFRRAHALVAAYGDRIRRAGEGEVLPGIEAILAPGHTPGHTAYRVQSGDRSLLIWGDVVHLPAIQLPRPEVGLTFDVDREVAAATRKRILDQVAAERSLVAGMHLEFPALGYVRRAGAGFAWVPEQWSAAS